MHRRSVGSPSPSPGQGTLGGTAKGTKSVFAHNGIDQPELVITASEAREWNRRNPHARPGVLEALAARGVLVIVQDGMMSPGVPDMRTTVPAQGVRA